jgi:hypothetical protein
MALAVALGWLAILERDFVTPGAAVPQNSEQEQEQKREMDV